MNYYPNNSIIHVTGDNEPIFCCSSVKEDSIEWFCPNGTSIMDGSVRENRLNHSCLGCMDCVTLSLTTGVFHCNISSTAADSMTKANLYVGVYNSGRGGENIPVTGQNSICIYTCSDTYNARNNNFIVFFVYR